MHCLPTALMFRMLRIFRQNLHMLLRCIGGLDFRLVCHRGLETGGARVTLLLVSVMLMGMLVGEAAAKPTVKDVRLGQNGPLTRLVIELSETVSYDLFFLNSPKRTVIDLPALDWPDGKNIQTTGVVDALRFGEFKETVSRVVLDLKRPARVQKAFILPPTAGFPHRLVIDLEPTSEEEFEKLVAKRQVQAAPVTASPVPEVVVPTAPAKNTKPVIVIDAGHGGVDPGAHGASVHEKHVVLSFAKELRDQLRNSGSYEVHLTRDRDIYIPLGERVNIARRHNADLFISIHADSISRKNVRGLSIYTLSETASDREAAALARKENRSDIIAGIDFGDQPPEVTNILIDLAQRETKNLSVKFAGMVVNKMQGKTILLDRTHRFAGFRVLKAPDVPSVLIELGFLTNRSDERQLQSTKWRRQVASALLTAINGYFASIKR